MFRIAPISNNIFPAAATRPTQQPQASKAPTAPQPAFGLATASFAGKAPQVKPFTPKLDMSQPAGRRLDYWA